MSSFLGMYLLNNMYRNLCRYWYYYIVDAHMALNPVVRVPVWGRDLARRVENLASFMRDTACLSMYVRGVHIGTLQFCLDDLIFYWMPARQLDWCLFRTWASKRNFLSRSSYSLQLWQHFNAHNTSCVCIQNDSKF